MFLRARTSYRYVQVQIGEWLVTSYRLDVCERIDQRVVWQCEGVFVGAVDSYW